MAIEKVPVPAPTAPGVLDYGYIIAQLEAKNQAFTGALIVDGSTIRAGRVFDIGGVLFKSVTDTAISGTAGKYVKITVSGDTATASFVSGLSGVAWNHAYGGYYHSDGSLVVFDEATAVFEGAVPKAYTIQGRTLAKGTGEGYFFVKKAVSPGNPLDKGSLTQNIQPRHYESLSSKLGSVIFTEINTNLAYFLAFDFSSYKPASGFFNDGSIKIITGIAIFQATPTILRLKYVGLDGSAGEKTIASTSTENFSSFSIRYMWGPLA